MSNRFQPHRLVDVGFSCANKADIDYLGRVTGARLGNGDTLSLSTSQTDEEGGRLCHS
jgi:hypothetical protein